MNELALTATPTPSRVLIIEDSDTKFEEVLRVVRDTLGQNVRTERAATVTIAEAMIVEEEWSLIILDISMDITASLAGPKRGGHATLGGMGIARKMFFLGREVETIIVTAFDAFQSSGSAPGTFEILGLEDVERSAKEILSSHFIGCVRYGDEGWDRKFRKLLEQASLP